MEDVDGKVAFITGGASGIGFGMAQVFLRNGMKVVIADINQKHLDEAGAALGGSNQKFHLMRVDVTDRRDMVRAADEVARVFGPVHVVCNNAGVASAESIDDASYAEWDRVINININGVVNGVATFVPRIKAHGEGGHIINTSSIAGILALSGDGGIYSMTKFAVRGLSESLRMTLAPYKIGVSVICPGLTQSRIQLSVPTTPEAANDPKLLDAHQLNQTIGMDPMEVGERVLLGIRRNDAYILPHGEFAEEVRELFDDIVAGFPQGQDIHPGRLAFEEQRRKAAADIKAQSRAE